MDMSITIALGIAAVGLIALVAVKPLSLVFPSIDGFQYSKKEGISIRTMQSIISLVVLFAALYVILFQHNADDATKKWAFGAMGTLLGFWLKH